MCRLLLLILASLVLLACDNARRPDLGALYRMSEAGGQPPPVVVIHGVFGARLRDIQTQEESWPGGFSRLLFSGYEELALPIDPVSLKPAPSSQEAFAITDRVAGRDFYGELLRTLEKAGGYRRGTPGVAAKTGEQRYYVFVYDWRQDNVESARALDALIEQVRRDYGDPALKVDLIAHSMGGLVARYYLRYGVTDVLDGDEFPLNFHGAERVRRVILLGTPNLGSVKALQNLLTGFRVGLRKIPPEVLATMPSAYQLLPHPLNDWIITREGSMLDRDLFDIDLWRSFQWSIFDPEVRARVRARFATAAEADAYLALLERYMARALERGRRFVWSLTVREASSPVRLIVFGGDCDLSPARVLAEEVGDDTTLRLWPDEITDPKPGIDYESLMLEPGDGSVTKASLLARTSLDPRQPRHRYSYFPLDYTVLLCERHDRLTGNINFQDNLLHVLLSQEL